VHLSPPCKPVQVSHEQETPEKGVIDGYTKRLADFENIYRNSSLTLFRLWFSALKKAQSACSFVMLLYRALMLQKRMNSQCTLACVQAI
jgi:hypothetical protein